MTRRPIFITVIILLFCSGAFAVIGQVGSFSVNAINEVTRAGTIGSAQSINRAEFGRTERAFNTVIGNAFVRGYNGNLVQKASVDGSSGKTTAKQTTIVNGTQGPMQGIGSFIPWSNGQMLSANLNTSLKQVKGIGSATARQSLNASQYEMFRGPYGFFGGESQYINAVQKANVSGEPDSNVKVNSNLDIKMGQGYMIR